MNEGARAAGVFRLGGVAPVARLGYGAMRIIGPGIIDEPADAGEARGVLLRAVELGVTFIDTAHAYGPLVSEQLIGETLAPYSRASAFFGSGPARICTCAATSLPTKPT